MAKHSETEKAETIEELRAQVRALSEKVRKQSVMLTKTGQQVLEIQLHNQKSRLDSVPNPQDMLNEGQSQSQMEGAPSAGLLSGLPPPRQEPREQHQQPPRQLRPQADSESNDYVTNEEIFQLVGELQGQLDFLEERSIRRGINMALESESARVAPLPDADGEEPPAEIFPATLKEFKALSDKQIVDLCSFYQLLPATEEDTQNIEDFIANKVQQLSLGQATNPSRYTVEQLDELHDQLARYVGIRYRRVAGSW